MLSTIGYVVLFAFGGTLLAAGWTFLVGFGGAPGAALACKLAPNEKGVATLERRVTSAE